MLEEKGNNSSMLANDVSFASNVFGQVRLPLDPCNTSKVLRVARGTICPHKSSQKRISLVLEWRVT